MCLDVQDDGLPLSVHFILCLLNFRWLRKTANKRTNWCQLQGFPQRNWDEPAWSFHTHDSLSLHLIRMISHLDAILDKNTNLRFVLDDIWSEVRSVSLISGTDTADFPELEFDFSVLNIAISVRIQYIDS